MIIHFLSSFQFLVREPPRRNLIKFSKCLIIFLSIVYNNWKFLNIRVDDFEVFNCLNIKAFAFKAWFFTKSCQSIFFWKKWSNKTTFYWKEFNFNSKSEFIQLKFNICSKVKQKIKEFIDYLFFMIISIFGARTSAEKFDQIFKIRNNFLSMVHNNWKF